MNFPEIPDTSQPVMRVMPPWRVALSRAYHALIRFRYRWIPYLVWRNSEIDVVVTFSQERLAEGGDPNEAIARLFSGRLHDARMALHDAGVEFDTGMGFGGRDWEWDYSLKGPISVRFKGTAARPHLRRARPKPRLATKDGRAA